MPDLVNVSSKEELYNWLKSREPLSVAAHHDADGVYSAALLSKIFEIGTIEFPDTFGNIDSRFDVALDFGEPIEDSEWDGLAIDHHPHDMNNKKYKLAHSYVPTGLIIYDLFKQYIDKKWTWLVAGSLVGDGQPALIPPEIFEDHPTLLEMRGTIYQNYGKYNFYEYTLYNLLASPINATCRVGQPYQAYLILKTCQVADDVITHPIFNQHQDMLTNEINSIIDKFGKDKKERNNLKYIGNFVVMSFSSKYRIASRLATTLQSNLTGKTIICIDKENRGVSVRGDLAYWLLKHMKPRGWVLGGHAGYCGGSLPTEGDPEELVNRFLKDLREIVYGSVT